MAKTPVVSGCASYRRPEHDGLKRDGENVAALLREDLGITGHPRSQIDRAFESDDDTKLPRRSAAPLDGQCAGANLDHAAGKRPVRHRIQRDSRGLANVQPQDIGLCHLHFRIDCRQVRDGHQGRAGLILDPDHHHLAFPYLQPADDAINGRRDVGLVEHVARADGQRPGLRDSSTGRSQRLFGTRHPGPCRSHLSGGGIGSGHGCVLVGGGRQPRRLELQGTFERLAGFGRSRFGRLEVRSRDRDLVTRGRLLGLEHADLRGGCIGLASSLDGIDPGERLASADAVALAYRQLDDLAHDTRAYVGKSRRHDLPRCRHERTEDVAPCGGAGVDPNGIGSTSADQERRREADEHEQYGEDASATEHWRSI